MNFLRLFNDYYGAMSKHKRQLHEIFLFNYEDLTAIRKSIKGGKKDGQVSYEFTNITLLIPKRFKPSHSIPRLLEDIEITLSLDDEVILNLYEENAVEDPIINIEPLTLNVILKSGKYTSSWHLDRHVRTEQEKISDLIHPRYHLTFGGEYMENLQVDENDEFGRSLIIRSPRIPYPPMEVLLGLDFIFRHFIPKSELDLLSDPAYNQAINQLKTHLWKPYALALVKGFCENVDIDNRRYRFDDGFVRSVVGDD